MNLSKMEAILDDYLEDNTLEDFLEQFDVTPLEAILLVYEAGLLDENRLERMTPVDYEGN